MAKVRLWTHTGVPLMTEESSEVPGYQRRTLGFLSPEERDKAHELLRRSRAERQAQYDSAYEDAEGVWIHEEEAGCSEGCTCE